MTRLVRAACGAVVLAMTAACAAPPPLALPTGDAGSRSDGPAPDRPTVIACTPGVSVTCMCNAMTTGRRACLDDGTYGGCECVDARVPCFPGAVQACVCGSFAGIQFCGEDGYFTGCECPETDLDATDATASDATLTDAPSPDAMDAGAADRPDVVDAPRDAQPDRPDVCACEADAARVCPLPAGQVPETYQHGRCRRGQQVCAGASCWGPCLGQVDPIDELCNSIDDNCNGLVDDITVSCGLGRCRRVASTCDAGRVVPCMPDFTQMRPETCNGIDDDCNGMIDDACRDL